MSVDPYLFFDGRCEEALEFYKGAIGAEVTMLMRFKESPDACKPGTIQPGSEDKVMHAEMRIGGSLVMASDGHCTGKPSFQGFGLAIAVKTEPDADQKFAALEQGGAVQMLLT